MNIEDYGLWKTGRVIRSVVMNIEDYGLWKTGRVIRSLITGFGKQAEYLLRKGNH